MEKVHFQQEQMLPALETLHELGLFTKPEISKIFETRSSFETRLIRRIARKDDFLQYILYERRLDALVRARWKRLNSANSKEKRSTDEKQALNSIRSRVFGLFERSVKKFRSDLGLWVEYIRFCREVGATSRASKVCARAMQMHPNNPAIYIFAVSGDGAGEDWSPYEQPSLSRSLLLRGLRLNKESVELWVAYVLWEYGWVEVVKKRWDVLGINPGEGPTASQRAEGLEDVLNGAIVKTVIEQAVKDLPSHKAGPFLRSLSEVFAVPETQNHLSPLRASIAQHIYSLLRQPPLTENLDAMELWATRSWNFQEGQPDPMELLGQTNQDFLEVLASSGEERPTAEVAPPGSEGPPIGTKQNVQFLLRYAQWMESALHQLAETTEDIADDGIPKMQWYLVLSLSRQVVSYQTALGGEQSAQGPLGDAKRILSRLLDELEHIGNAEARSDVDLEEIRTGLLAEISRQ